jgi:hypothetical protein
MLGAPKKSRLGDGWKRCERQGGAELGTSAFRLRQQD